MIKIEQLQINDIILCKEGKKVFPVKVNLSLLVDISLHPKKYFPIELTKEFMEKNKFEAVFPGEKNSGGMYIVHKDFFGPELMYWHEENAIALIHKDKDGIIRKYHGFPCKYLHELQQFLRHFEDYHFGQKEVKFVI